MAKKKVFVPVQTLHHTMEDQIVKELFTKFKVATVSYIINVVLFNGNTLTAGQKRP